MPAPPKRPDETPEEREARHEYYRARRRQRRRQRARRRLVRRLLTALPVILIGAGVAALVVWGLNREPEAPDPSVTIADVETAMPEPEVVKPTRAAFLGDSYISGTEETIEQTFVGPLSRSLGWKPVLFGQGGTGFTNPGQADENESTFVDRVPAVVRAQPDVVIVEGGLNDGGDAAVTEAAAAQVFSALKRGLPDATIIAVGPSLPPGGDVAAIDRARSAIYAAAVTNDVPFVDPAAEKWLVDKPELYVDGIHMNAEGNRIYADLLRQALIRLGVVEAPTP